MSRFSRQYVGRFAPSPTGPLHFGSIVAAVASWVDARAHGGRWLVRMEDVDAPRIVPGAAELILDQLVAHGLEWDGEIIYQSRRGAAYQAALDRLIEWTFPCACSRREAENCDCRAGLAAGKAPRAIRLRGTILPVEFHDRLQGLIAEPVSDFVVKRADGLWAYQLAVVVDDAEQGITEIVRGADLLDSTPRQIQLQNYLGVPHPRYLHIPVVVDRNGEKLSKQTHAPALDSREAAHTVAAALRFLGQAPAEGSTREILDAAVASWDVARIPRVRCRECASS